MSNVSGTVSEPERRLRPHTGTIPPATRKRKAAEATISSNSGSDAPSNKRIASAATIDKEAAPPTPVTMTSNGMDSEEDFMSNVTSDEEMQDFSDDGQYHPPLPPGFALMFVATMPGRPNIHRVLHTD